MKSLVSVAWLKDNLDDPDLLVLYTNLRPIPEGLEGMKIPHARLFDLKYSFRDRKNLLPNSFPTVQIVQDMCRKLGIEHSSKVVIYDPEGMYSSPRAWFILKSMGLEHVAVLDGGLPAWKNAEHKLADSGENELYFESNFTAIFDPSFVVSISQIKKNIFDQDFVVVDARSKGRFEGTSPEPRVGLRSGSIPESISLPYAEVLTDGFYKPIEELESIFCDLNISDKKVVFSCGSGITACIILLAMDQFSDRRKAIFDGSWTQWALTYPA